METELLPPDQCPQTANSSKLPGLCLSGKDRWGHGVLSSWGLGGPRTLPTAHPLWEMPQHHSCAPTALCLGRGTGKEESEP